MKLNVVAVVLPLSIALGVMSARADDQELLLGQAVALTGTLASFDVPVFEGERIAIDEINAAGGIGGKVKIREIVKDTRSEAAPTAVMAQELVDEKVNILIAPCDADPSFAAAPIATAAQIPMFSSCGSSPGLSLIGGDFVFINYPADNVQAAVAAQYAYQQGYRAAYVLYSPDTQYTTMPLYFAEAFKSLGGSVVAESTYQLGQQDFSAEVTKIKSLNPAPDVIYTSAYEPDFPSFLRQLRGTGINTPVIGSDGIDTPTTFSLGAVGEGLVFTTAGHPVPGSEMEKFMAKYQTRYGHPSQTIYNAVGYDLIKVIEAAVIANGLKTDGVGLRDAIANLENVQGATAKITYKGAHGVPIRPGFLIRVKDGKREFLGSVLPDPSLIPKPRLQ
ncbi:ABC transporter substrate-binding protein [Mesorhizobium sophorae]|uniref:ABC transporter substrate-binding protein n=1 Tax=Mesorhizobium sophorae TaxID=1300294 RepID=UPI000BA36F35|nr:ABC transporter substrate-binding protein [Mesorhizobium sophorae]